MAVKLLCLWMLLLLLYHSRATEPTCLSSASSCDECIQSDSVCAWCSSPRASVRCSTLSGLLRAGCPQEFIHNPVGRMQVVKNNSRTDPADVSTLLLQPQEVSLHLRPRVSWFFPLTVTMPTDQPKITLDLSNVPAGVNITFRSIMEGNPQLLQVKVEAAQCPSKSDSSNQKETGPWSIFITPRGFSLSVKLELTLLCQCNCSGNREENSPDCSGHGALTCGRCECNKPYFGQHCHLRGDSFLSQEDSLCMKGPNAPLCSGRGSCVQGFCECTVREDPKEQYYGRYCECSNFNCPYFENRLCGGNGKCECGRCKCLPNWIGEDCSCPMDGASCMTANQTLCNGRGTCVCGKCLCMLQYSGRTCEEGPVFLDVCQQRAACAECRRKGDKINTCHRQCGLLAVKMVETQDDLPTETGRLCKMRSRDDHCFFFYTISTLPSGDQLTVARAKEC